MGRSAGSLCVVLAASEAVPFCKTGGLADVVGALAPTLDRLGHEVILIIPDYFTIRQSTGRELPPVTETGLRFSVVMHNRSVMGSVGWTTLPDSQVRVLLVRQPEYFDRRQLYQERGHDYVDNCERFCFFSRAVLEICRQMVLRPDVIHCNDWQTGVIPALLATEYARRPGFESTGSVMTLHNMAYQGRFWHLDMPLTGMDWKYFNYQQMEAWGDLCLLKTGIAFADQITTVSPTYAREICHPDGGFGLDSLLRHRQSDLVGILNGIDETVWNPETDPLLPARYSLPTLAEGKSVCRRHLQERVRLEPRSEPLLLGMVSRMTDQKGLDLVMGAAARILAFDVQLVFLGTGEPAYESWLHHLSETHPGRVAAVTGFDEGLAHQIEAGADAFLMPSRFEPCGLNQMYSQRYGTVPIVRNVGGLADSVTDLALDHSNLATATGFAFTDYRADRLAETVERAARVHADRAVWNQLMANGMSRDWSWSRSAAEYVGVYHKAVSAVSRRAAEGRS